MKKILRKPALLPFMAAAAICGLSVYAVGETLNWLFQDVAPDDEKELPRRNAAPKDQVQPQ